MGPPRTATGSAAAGLLLLARGDVSALAFIPPNPNAASGVPRLPSWSRPVSPSRARDLPSLAGHGRHDNRAAANPGYCNFVGRRSCAAGGFATGEETLQGSSSSSTGGAVGAAAVVEGGSEREERDRGVGVVTEVGTNNSSISWGGGGLTPSLATAAATTSPVAGEADAVEAGAAPEGWGVVDGIISTQTSEWEGAAWTEFEDWLIQDTYSRYVIGSGKHVLWRRMVREVPELMERTPQEARQRWLRLTGRLGGDGARGGGEEGANKMLGSPALDSFYVQPPVLEQWEEIVEGEGMGCFRGNVFGQRGLADGTAMTTAPVDVSGRKIQDQYVATQCGVVYELGERRETDLVGQASSKMLKIAPATVLALAGAFYALTALSHHVQVEVFVI